MFGIHAFIGFVERVEPGAFAVLISRERLGQQPVLLLGERAQKLDVVRRRAVIREREEDAGVSLLERLMEREGGILAPAFVYLGWGARRGKFT
jgi:hypothetical protein